MLSAWWIDICQLLELISSPRAMRFFLLFVIVVSALVGLSRAQTHLTTDFCVHSTSGVWPDIQPDSQYTFCTCPSGASPAFSNNQYPGVDLYQCYQYISGSHYPTFSVHGGIAGTTISVGNAAFSICGIAGGNTYMC